MLDNQEVMLKSSDNSIRYLMLANGDKIKINLYPSITGTSRFAFSLHKAGSSLLNSMLYDYCENLNIAFVDLPVSVSQAGYAIENIIAESTKGIVEESGYLYLGWRNYAKCLNQIDFSKTRNILLVRDPRDRLVSQYYSFGRSHKVPEKGEIRDAILSHRQEITRLSIDQYAFKMINWIKINWNSYHAHLSPSTTRIYRYEDVIFKKEEWLRDIVKFFDLNHDDEVIKRVALKNDIIPEIENPDKHIRQVYPGNYLLQYQKSTIDELNKKLHDILSIYGYFEPTDFGRRIVFAKEGKPAKRILTVKLLSDQIPMNLNHDRWKNGISTNNATFVTKNIINNSSILKVGKHIKFAKSGIRKITRIKATPDDLALIVGVNGEKLSPEGDGYPNVFEVVK
jgi:hypothetical protein